MKKTAVAAILMTLIATSTPAQDWDAGPIRASGTDWLFRPTSPAAEIHQANLPAVWLNHSFIDLLRSTDPGADPWHGFNYDPGRLKLTRDSILESAKVQSKLDLADPRILREMPWYASDWKAQNSLNLPLPAAEYLFVFGSFDGQGQALDNRQLRMTGKTGFGMKWTPFSRGEVQFRSGPVVNVSDVYNPIRPQKSSQLSVELQAKLDLFGPLQLQYSGEALPALVQADRHTFLQDLKLALPFGSNREFQIGAKYRWEDLSTSPWLDRTQLYLGLKFQH